MSNGSGLYVPLHRMWKDGDRIKLVLSQPVRLEQAHPHTCNMGRGAISCGPIVYCVEAVDHPGVDVFNLIITSDSRLEKHYDPKLLG